MYMACLYGVCSSLTANDKYKLGLATTIVILRLDFENAFFVDGVSV
jgi:hypothetical protein